MKIALVTETYPPDINGVAMTLQRIVTGFSERGHEVMVIRPGRRGSATLGSSPDQILVAGLPLPGYPQVRIGLPCGHRLKRVWQKWGPDLIHVATEGPLGWSAVRAACAERIPLSTSFHSNFHAYTRHYGIGFLRPFVVRYLRSIHRKAHATFVPTGEVMAELQRLSFSHMKILSRGVDTDLFNPEKRCHKLRADWGAGPNDPVLITVSRMAPEKNLPLVARAFAAIREHLSSARLVFVGDGPEMKRMQRIFPEHLYLGFKYGEELAMQYASADFFLFASETETFGNVIPEAMASGLPLLAYDYAAGALLIRDGKNGFSVEQGSSECFIARAREAALERMRWPELGAEARRAVLGMPWNSVLDNFERDLKEIAMMKGPR